MDVVVAVHGREVRTAPFPGLSSPPNIDIAATETATGELTSYGKAFEGISGVETLKDVEQLLEMLAATASEEGTQR
jgi:hypothetical protein